MVELKTKPHYFFHYQETFWDGCFGLLTTSSLINELKRETHTQWKIVNIIIFVITKPLMLKPNP